MAVSRSSSWFHSWNPPNPVLPDTYYKIDHSFNEPESTEWRPLPWEEQQHLQKGNQKTAKPPSILPYLLSFGLLAGLHPASNAPRLGKFRENRELERTGPFTTWYAWKQLDFAFQSEEQREAAIENGNFIPENNLPLGIEVYGDRLFVSMPKWKDGVPITLGVLPKYPLDTEARIEPYPNWDFHNTNDCDGLTSVYRMEADECGRLWVIDSGQIEVTIKPKQVCPPQIHIFDLETDKLLLRYDLPEEFIKQDSLYSNIKVDVRKGRCEDAYAYVTDVWRFGLVTFSLREMRSWRITDHLFYPDPLAAAYKLDDLEFEWTDGIFGMALSPVLNGDRILYFNPMSSFREFYVRTSVVQNETGWNDVKDAFKVLGQSRGKSGHASASAMDRNGILIYNQVTRNSIGCWDSRKPYLRQNLGVLANDNDTLIFPNDMKIDQERKQNVWVITNKLPFYLYKKLDPSEINFRIMSANINEAIKGTVCDPKTFGSQHPFDEELDCY
ncbi:PREDICTED: protein yellow-like [Nicrophorus vespilloides]|uniref:Protein yellow-like n=1 Tax=Nicrophorus vespilloides TaxID=110193 RepID=A0ABM1MW14_NICVS|nr:PREDICTED: protein yellow-like [Nicrophorus vespilloides]XP_017778763.1 PREDICTED: protein yellow-like [Nicrophorus vespilloides]XP_017778764.1 PREDICTED: protein yellow-like [Nicrophorus vespilloides]